jgi:hypothetical protein
MRAFMLTKQLGLKAYTESTTGEAGLPANADGRRGAPPLIGHTL